ILNQADEREIEVISASIKRRQADSKLPGQQNIGKMAQNMASSINRQVESSVGQVRDIVKGAVADIIRKEAPELAEEQVEQLLQAWIPGEGEQQNSPGRSLPGDVLLTMIKQFIKYSTGSMPVAEQSSMAEAITDWPKKYWEKFPGEIQELLSKFLKGQMDSDAFWNCVQTHVRL
ncbi:unnamed protein product, partial [marine sediment metagenome]